MLASQGVHLRKITVFQTTSPINCGLNVFCLGNPCLGQWIGSSDKCDKLVNGTNGSWLKVSSKYYKQEWCKSFEICFQSQKLKERCLTDFEFYYHYFKYPGYKPKFTFEIGTYLSGTRILVTYDLCYYQYLFAVNIIRCSSFENNSGSGTYTFKTTFPGSSPLKIARGVAVLREME